MTSFLTSGEITAFEKIYFNHVALAEFNDLAPEKKLILAERATERMRGYLADHRTAWDGIGEVPAPVKEATFVWALEAMLHPETFAVPSLVKIILRDGDIFKSTSTFAAAV